MDITKNSMNYNLLKINLNKMVVVIIFWLLMASNVHAQKKPTIDSLLLKMKVTKDTALVDLYNELAYEYRNLEVEKTLLYTDSAIAKAKKIKYTRGLGNAYLNRGNYYKNIGDNAQARACFIWAYVQHEKTGDIKGLSATINSMASLHFLQGRLTLALYNFIKSLTLSRQINDRRGEAITLNNIGVINQEQKNYSKALEYYEQSYHTFKDIGEIKLMPDPLNNIGNIYHILGIIEDALKYYNEAMTTYVNLGDVKGESSTMNNIGLLYYEKKDYKTALKFYQKSLGIDEKLNDKQAQTITCNNIAYCYFYLDMFFAAKKYAERALKSSIEQNDKIDMVNSYELLAKIEDELGNYKQALVYYKLYTANSDSLYSEETRQKLEDIEAQYEAEKSENERLIKALGKDGDKEVAGNNIEAGIARNVQTIALVLISFVLVMFGVVYLSKRK